jgi:hypothetical protein
MATNLTNITKPIQEVVETVVTPLPPPMITEEHPTPRPKIRRAGFKAMNYDNQNGGMTSESGRFKVR